MRRAWCITVGLLAASTVQAGPVFFTDEAAFRVAAGNVHEIDFETLPDGTATPPFRTDLSPAFNYTNQGVTFSAPVPDIFVIDRGGEIGATLEADHFSGTSGFSWIIAHFVTPATAVGIVFPGGTTLSVFDEQANLITELTGGGSGVEFFLGIVGDDPIATAVIDRDVSYAIVREFQFVPIPEPATIVLLAVGALAFVPRKRNKKREISHVQAV